MAFRFAAFFGCGRKKVQENTECRWEAKEQYMIRNGALLLEKQISYGHGKASDSNPIRIFSFDEIKKATHNFDDRLIFDREDTIKYRGTLEDGRIVVIVTLLDISLAIFEIDLLLNHIVINQIINHKNVSRLHGCCLETQWPILVHEFPHNGTLFDHIHGRDGAGNSISIPDFNIPWSELLRIAADVSHALSYIHLALPKPIVHMYLKPSSIALDESFNAKLSNFGYSVSITPGEDFISQFVAGPKGYIDPEHQVTLRVTEKCDVYIFGVILVELLTGKNPRTMLEKEGCNLVDCFSHCLTQVNGVSRIVHPTILTEAAADEMQAFVGLAVRCIASRGDERPTKREVAIELRRIHLATKQRQR